MPQQPPLGLYDEVLTSGLRTDLRQRESVRVHDSRLDEAEAPLYLTQHLAALIERALRSVGGLDMQVRLVNEVVQQVALHAPDAVNGLDQATNLLLEALTGCNPLGIFESPPASPGIPLSQSALLINARSEHRIGHELSLEIESADRIDLLCAFIKWSGFRLFEEKLRAFTRRGGMLRVISTVYMGATERRALDALVDLGADVRLSFDIRRTRLHAKAWLFHRETGYSTAYIGSSNLTAAAQLDGLEWNVRVSSVDARRVIDKFAAAFDGYWEDSEFQPYVATAEQARVLDHALKHEEPDSVLAFLEVRPYPFQKEILERLSAERFEHHRYRNLVLAATGTGKTVIAALDYRRLLQRDGKLTLLFVAHREEILRQSRTVVNIR